MNDHPNQTCEPDCFGCIESLDELNESDPGLSLETARWKKVCRVCREPMYYSGGRALGSLTFNYGEEYAHTDCLKGRNNG